MITNLTKREKAILEFINEFGFCEIDHIQKKFQLSRTTSYVQMKLLIRLGMIRHESILPNEPGVFYLSMEARKFIKSDLSHFTHIPRNAYFHHRTVIHVAIKVMQDYPDGIWVSERRLHQERYEKNIHEHLPDGILWMSDKKKIVIEVELTLKNRERLREILTDYVIDNTIHEVWYFCVPSIMSVMTEINAHFPKIKLFLLEKK